MHKLKLPKGVRAETLTGTGFQLRRQRIEDTEADYLTVMANRDHLRNWCNDTWPENDFTLGQNRDDLANHIEEAEAGISFGYTVWDPDANQVLGSVYLNPTAFYAARYKLSDAERLRLDAATVLVDYWLSHELELTVDFHRQFILYLQDWLRNDWGFNQAAWATRPAMHQRRRLYESLGFTWGQSVESQITPGWYQTFHLSSGEA